MRDRFRPQPPPDNTVTLIARFQADPHLQRVRLMAGDETTPGALFVKRRRMAEFRIALEDSDLAVESLAHHDGRLVAAALLVRIENGIIIERAGSHSRRRSPRLLRVTLEPSFRLQHDTDGIIEVHRRNTAQTTPRRSAVELPGSVGSIRKTQDAK
jgi:hypothetical protein